MQSGIENPSSSKTGRRYRFVEGNINQPTNQSIDVNPISLHRAPLSGVVIGPEDPEESAERAAVAKKLGEQTPLLREQKREAAAKERKNRFSHSTVLKIKEVGVQCSLARSDSILPPEDFSKGSGSGLLGSVNNTKYCSVGLLSPLWHCDGRISHLPPGIRRS